eukprot:jgi/Bigna1/71439/fgenesh1_pg.15_\
MIVYALFVAWNVLAGLVIRWFGGGFLSTLLGCLGSSAWMFDMLYLLEFHVRAYYSLKRFHEKGPMPLTEWHEIAQIAAPMDIDIFGHMNNARYNRRAEYSRISYFIECGLRRASNGLGIRGGILKSMAMRFRRQINPFQTFSIRIKLIGWKGKELYFQQRMVTKDARGEEFVNAFSVSIYKIPRKSKYNAIDMIKVIDPAFAKTVGTDSFLSDDPNDDLKMEDNSESKSISSAAAAQPLSSQSSNGQQESTERQKKISVSDLVRAYNRFEELSSTYLNPNRLRN